MRANKRLILIIVTLAMLLMATPALAAEEGGPLASLGINLGFLIAQIINFGLILGVLLFFLWRPMVNMLDSRREEIEKGLEDAAAAANARRNAEQEAEKILSQARSEASRVVDEARSRGEELQRSIESEAREEAERIREEARASAEAERNTELSKLRNQVTTISLAVAQRLIGEELDEKKQQALIDDFFSKVPADAKSLSGELEVVSAMPLSDDEQSKVKKELGVDNVTFNVEPEILGGLIVRSEDRVVDGSVRRDMNELASRLT